MRVPGLILITLLTSVPTAAAPTSLNAESDCYRALWKNFAIGHAPRLHRMEAAAGMIGVVRAADILDSSDPRFDKGAFVLTREGVYFVEYPRKADLNLTTADSVEYTNYFKLPKVTYVNSLGNTVQDTLYLTIDAFAPKSSPAKPTKFKAGHLEPGNAQAIKDRAAGLEPLSESEAKKVYVLELQRELDTLQRDFKTAPTDGTDVSVYVKTLEICKMVPELQEFAAAELKRKSGAPKPQPAPSGKTSPADKAKTDDQD